jgi:hypothetical protein
MDRFSGRLLETRFCDTPEKTVQHAKRLPTTTINDTKLNNREKDIRRPPSVLGTGR